MRASSYNIYLKSSNPEYSYIVHGYSGAIDMVTNNVAQFLKSTKYLSEEEIHNNNLPIEKETLELLKKRGYLTIKTPDEEKDHVAKMADLLHKRFKSQSGFLFLVTYNCNFRYPYCYETNFSKNGKGWSKKVFTRDMVNRAYASMLEIQPQKERHGKSITLYGGEPLLIENYEIVSYIVDEGLKRGFTFSAITNGYDLDKYADIVVPGKIQWLQISIDGIPETHNKRRTHFLAGNSFDKIIKNIEGALARGVTISVRINTDVTNLGELAQVVDIFKQKGFLSYKNFSSYSAILHGEERTLACNTIMVNDLSMNDQSAGCGNIKEVCENELTTEERQFYFESINAQYIDFEKEEDTYKSLLKNSDKVKFYFEKADKIENERIELLNRSNYFREVFDQQKRSLDMKKVECQDSGIRKTLKNALDGKGLMNFRSTYCSAQSSMIIFDPYGDLYTCWEHVGDQKSKIGSYKEKLEYIDTEINKWFDKNISKVPACSKCKYAMFCGGGCTMHAVLKGNGFRSPECDGYPGMFQVIASDTIAEFLAKMDNTQNKTE